jgi:hypothetical protein
MKNKVLIKGLGAINILGPMNMGLLFIKKRNIIKNVPYEINF